jgi:hypothetical protein
VLLEQLICMAFTGKCAWERASLELGGPCQDMIDEKAKALGRKLDLGQLR